MKNVRTGAVIAIAALTGLAVAAPPDEGPAR